MPKCLGCKKDFKPQGCGGEAGDGGIQVLLTGDFEAFGTPNNLNCRPRAYFDN
jgi:hypothetical protein